MEDTAGPIGPTTSERVARYLKLRRKWRSHMSTITTYVIGEAYHGGKHAQLTEGDLDSLLCLLKRARKQSKKRGAEVARLAKALNIATIALIRLSQNDEMAGMGQRDGDPEALTRCQYAARALEQIKEA